MNNNKNLAENIAHSNETRLSQQKISKMGIKGGAISVLGNLIIFILKIIFGVLSNSLALIADAFHSLSDLATSVVVIIGFKVSQKPADKEHPFGHGRADTIATLIIAIVIVVVGIEFIINGVQRLINPQPINVSFTIFSVVLVTAILKEIMARYINDLGNRLDSDTLRGDAQHHRSDVYSSLLVLVALFGAKYGMSWLDGTMGIGIALIMFNTAYSISQNAIDDLLGKPISNETREKIKNLSKAVDGVFNVHDIIVHSYGGSRFISLHIEVDEKLTSNHYHRIADTVEKKISSNMNAEVVTHIDPVSISGEDVKKISTILGKILNNYNLKQGFHDLRVVGEDIITSIIFEVPLPHNFEKKTQLEEELNIALISEFRNCDIKIECKQQILYN